MQLLTPIPNLSLATNFRLQPRSVNERSPMEAATQSRGSAVWLICRIDSLSRAHERIQISCLISHVGSCGSLSSCLSEQLEFLMAKGTKSQTTGSRARVHCIRSAQLWVSSVFFRWKSRISSTLVHFFIFIFHLHFHFYFLFIFIFVSFSFSFLFSFLNLLNFSRVRDLI
jgi:hypothetical protein